MQDLCSTIHKGMCLPLYPSSLSSGNMIRNAHSLEGDELLKVKSINMAYFPVESFISLQVSSSISSMSQHLESRESIADNEHVYEVMGEKNLILPHVLLSARS